MTDRWNPKWVTRPVEHPTKVFVPGGEASAPSSELNSQHRVTDHPAGFRIRERGALDATVVHSYRCPVHGVMDAEVPRSEVPDAVPCDWETVALVGGWTQTQRCDRMATWAGSFCGQGHAAGEVAC